MTPREIVLAQVNHQQTDPVPYTLAFEPEVAERLDHHYGGDAWRQRIVPYMAHCGAVGRFPTEVVDEFRYRDAFGSRRGPEGPRRWRPTSPTSDKAFAGAAAGWRRRSQRPEGPRSRRCGR
jgi:hypothetical protein